ncbi:glycosyltransferase [Kineococcus indalonis]|uniref:glycosyltransferase n=1 Tax=Kineococcus indalonis TaxID=2696566 RepID=UPI00141268DB|nr:glycosyltransferase family 2 protein [Kineococcus indalonis]NAZ86317.1 glycosyltransferase [Kineococcus indalonis]
MGARSVYVSGCYIVKDEEDVLAASLEALAPFVDEIVVYDTGSTDRTREVAREHGARVVEGYWDDDFGAARNRALEHCAGTWVVSVDADEVVRGDVRAWRRALQRENRADVLEVAVASDTWGGAGRLTEARVPRVLRRAHCRWAGALHERLVGRRGQVLHRADSGLVFEHSGYTLLRVVDRDKGTRNLRVAEAELEAARARGEHDLAFLHVNVGRSAAMVGDHRKALDAFAAIDRETAPLDTGLLAAQTAVSCALAVGDLDLAAEWLTAMRTWGEDDQVCRAFEARVAMAGKRYAEAERLLRSVRDSRNRIGIRFDAESCTDDLVRCVLEQGRREEAAQLVLEHLPNGRTNLQAPFVVGLLATDAEGAARTVAALPPSLEKPFVGQLQRLPADFTDAFFEALWAAGRARAAVLLAVGEQWASLAFPRALEWSLRMREAGLAERCPLRRILASPECDRLTRILSGVVLAEVGEADALPVLEGVLAEVEDAEVDTVLAAVRELSPSFADSLVAA